MISIKLMGLQKIVSSFLSRAPEGDVERFNGGQYGGQRATSRESKVDIERIKGRRRENQRATS